MKQKVVKFFAVLKTWILYRARIRKMPNFTTITNVGEGINVSFPTFEKDIVEGFGFKIIKYRTDWGLISYLYDDWQVLRENNDNSS